ncbi:MAG TPA: hypothetical protein DCL43_02205 [Chitinophagaceae bacterium]|nr:hypothetical protein [Chitinophagaceae bacterium]HAN39667.1 hypothetical protein [Chitinophagaceae bacterium]
MVAFTVRKSNLFISLKNFVHYSYKNDCYMIKFNEIKVGDYLMAEYEGQQWWGEVTRLNGDEKQVCVATEVQDFWFTTEHLYPIALNDESLMMLNFSKEQQGDGSIKYKKGAFRLVIPTEGNFENIDIWYREDRRHHPAVKYVHQLQNYYHDMTKVHLTNAVMV